LQRVEQRIWSCRGRVVRFDRRPLIMGILNATPDSFYDGGRYTSREAARTRIRTMVDEGADILDIGGESSRPGSERIGVEEELRRVMPLVEIAVAETGVVVSVDTMKADVARRALEAGAHIINDISALRHDAGMVQVVAEHGAGLVLMHMQGEPKTMQENPTYCDVVEEVSVFLKKQTAFALKHGCAEDQIVWDPGLGFGKTFEHNWTLLTGTSALAREGRPLMIGASRKRFLGALCDRETDDRLAASLAVAAYASHAGAHLLRVHDVIHTCDVVRVMAKLHHQEREHDMDGADTVAGPSGNC